MKTDSLGTRLKEKMLVGDFHMQTNLSPTVLEKSKSLTIQKHPTLKCGHDQLVNYIMNNSNPVINHRHSRLCYENWCKLFSNIEHVLLNNSFQLVKSNCSFVITHLKYLLFSKLINNPNNHPIFNFFNFKKVKSLFSNSLFFLPE